MNYKDEGRDTVEELKEMADSRKENSYYSVVELIEHPNIEEDEFFIKIPDELLEELGWKAGDDIKIENTEICDIWGEHKGFTVANLTKNPKVKPNTWKYGLIKVALDGPSFDTVQINMLVELYPLGKTGEYDTFCRASLQTLEDIEMAKRDVERDGINEYFFNNGTFKWAPEKEACAWDWTPKEDDDG